MSVEKIDGEGDLEGASPHEVDEKGRVLKLLAIHGDQIHYFTSCILYAARRKTEMVVSTEKIPDLN